MSAAVDIPQGHGVRCSDCGNGQRVSSNPPQYQEGDERLSRLFSCPKKPKWQRVHEDLAHPCFGFTPAEGVAKVEFYPLPGSVARLALEQAAADPGNDRIAAVATAARIYRTPRPEAYREIEKIKGSNPLFGTMVEGLYDEFDTTDRKKGIKPGGRQGQGGRF